MNPLILQQVLCFLCVSLLFLSNGAFAATTKPTTKPATKIVPKAVTKADAGESLRKRVVEVKLKNGMVFLLVQRKTSPTFSGNIRVRAGGVDEEIGYTGLAHIFEHMAFKGSTVVGTKSWKKEKAFLSKLVRVGEAYSRALVSSKGQKTPAIRFLEYQLKSLQRMHKQLVKKDEFMQIYQSNGGTGLNATTGKDLTSYFLSLPSNRLELWARQEATRLTSPVFREFYRERSVVVEERRMAMSSGMRRLYEKFIATAFQAHPYRFPGVGWMSDITTIPLRKVKEFFKRYYVPSNMVGSIVGDIDIEKTKKILENTFGKIPAGKNPPPVRTLEPKQDGERRVNMRFHTNPAVMIGFHKPTAPHRDDDVFDLIHGLLVSGRSSRLYKALVKKKIAQGLWASSLPGSRYPNVFTLFAKPIAPNTTKDVEKAIYKELERLKTELVSKAELDKVRKNYAMSFLRGLRSNKGLSNQLSYFQAILGNWKYATTINKRMNRITAQDIQRVAKTYFLRSNRTVATLVKEKAKAGNKKLSKWQKRRKAFMEMRNFQKNLRKNPQWIQQAKKLLSMYQDDPGTTVRPLPDGLKKHPGKVAVQKISFTPPKPTIVKLANGIKLYLLEDKELPLIDVYALVRAGKSIVPTNKVGLGSLVGSMLRSGGIKGISSEKLNEILATKAVNMESGMGNELGFAYLSTHKQDTDWSLDKLYRMLRYPSFEKEKLALKKSQMLEAYRRRNDRPFGLAIRQLRPLIFGKKHRRGLFPSPTTIKSISRQDLVAFHKRYYQPQGMSIAVVGDFKKEEMVAKIKKLFGAWKGTTPTFPKPKKLAPKVKPQLVLIRRKLPQTIILVGHYGAQRKAKDLVAAKVMNHILGSGGFTSRLMREIRSNRGLAYFAGSQLQAGKDKGVFLAYTGTRPQKTTRTLKLFLGILKSMKEKPSITKAELDLAKKTLLNRFIFLFSSPAKIVYRRMQNDFLGRPANYLQLYKKKVESLTVKDIEAAAKKYIDPSQFVTLVIGWDPLFDSDLSSFGKVKRVKVE